MNRTLKEAEHLHGLGFSVLWLKPKSKAPIRSKWTTGGRESWEALKKSFSSQYNVGVRLGRTSKIGDKFLAVIDIDVKSTEKHHQEEALKAVSEFFPGIEDSVTVLSGRGNGSRHIYVLTKEPAKSFRLSQSEDRVKVFMPSAGVSESQKKFLTDEELNEGFRMRPAWEISVMGEGSQVVLPPSLHPDSKREYAWKKRIHLGSDLRVIDLEVKPKSLNASTLDMFSPVDFPEDPEIIKLLNDTSYLDKSGGILKAAIAMVKANWTDIQIASALTDRSFFLGEVAYEHRKTESRLRAADWILKYTIPEARRRSDPKLQFEGAPETRVLGEEEAKIQSAEVLSQDWKNQIEKHGGKGENSGRPKNLLRNVVLILTNEVASDVIKRNTFSYRDFYTYDTPWGGKKDQALNDDEVKKIIFWLSHRFRFEPAEKTVEAALTIIAERNGFDPLRSWLESLPPWDGVMRLNTWLKDNFGAQGDPDYIAQVFRKWVFAMILRTFEPAAAFDWMPIFEGAQGIGKSSFGRILVGEEYFVDWLPDLGDKDAVLALQGAWCVEMGELASLRRNEIDIVKAFLSRRIDKIRPPYGKRNIEAPRRCVFFGTTNRENYLKDTSGNRRFKPIKVGKLNFKALEKDREKLFSEALFLYKNELEDRFPLDIEGEKAKRYELEIQSEKMVESEATLMAEKLKEFKKEEYKKKEENRFSFDKFKLSKLFSGGMGPLQKWPETNLNMQFAADALRSLGGNKRKIRGDFFWFF